MSGSHLCIPRNETVISKTELQCSVSQFLYTHISVRDLYGRRFCSLGRLGHEVGWKYQDIVAALEAKRKVKGEAFHKGKLEVAKAKEAVLKDPKIAKRIAVHQKVIESFGYQ